MSEPTREVDVSRWQHLAVFCGASISYYVFAYLALMMAVPPAFAAPVWPSAGIAVVVVAAWRWPAILGVFVGAAVANAGVGIEGMGRAWSVSAVLGLGATLQATLGAGLVRRFAGFPSDLDEPRPILRFVALAGPVACLVMTVVGPATLLYDGVIGTETWGRTAALWWFGDSLGVVAVAPVLALLFASPVRRKGVGLIAGPAVLVAALTLVGFSMALDADERRVDEALTERAVAVETALELHLAADFQTLRSLGALFEARDSVTWGEFHVFTRAQMRGVQALEWIPRVPVRGREQFEAYARDLGFPEYRIREADATGALVPAASREEYAPVLLVEPLEGNEAAVGFDLGSDVTRRQTLALATERRDITTTPPIRLIQETEDQAGYLMVQPVYRRVGADWVDPDTPVGFALGVYRAGDLMEAVLAEVGVSELRVALFDGPPESGTPLYLPEEEGGAAISHEASVEVAGRTWHLVVSGTPAFVAAYRGWTPWGVAAAGLVFSGLLTCFLLLVTGRTAVVEELVAARTTELEAASEALRAAKEETEARATELERSNRDLESFAYVASHDLREPLRMVASFTGLLRSRYVGQLDEQADEFIGFAVDGASRMQILIDDLLEYSRVGRGGRPPTLVDLETVVDEIAEEVLRGQPSTVTVTRTDLPSIVGDEPQLRQLFRNLVSNGVKFGGDAPVVNVSAVREGGGWSFRVRDNGIGIAPEYHERVFQIFSRLHSRSEFEGTGIGLAICRRAVESAGGSIRVESEPGEGSTFIVWLPATAPSRGSRVSERSMSA